MEDTATVGPVWSALRLLGLAILFLVAVVLVATGGKYLFYLPGMAAKTLASTLTGSEEGPLATLFFLLFAGVYVGAIGGLLLGLTYPFGRQRPPPR
jgi:hypothetical protein